MSNNQTKQQTAPLDNPQNRPQIESKALFGKTRQLSILHEGEIYALRITSRGKLILTK